MEKIFKINGRTYAVISYTSDENCYRLVYLPMPDTSTNSPEAINLIDDTACEDYYGDIDTVADIMLEQIREEAEKPYPWWILMGAVYERGTDPIIIYNEEDARSFAHVLNGATSIGIINMENEEEVRISKEHLNLEDFDVTAIHTFVNGSYGTFSLAEEWS